MLLRHFYLWAPLAALAGVLAPELLAPLRVAIVPLLTLVMLCMGLTLGPADFIAVLSRKRAVAAGMALQFSIMPLSALLLSLAFGLDAELTTGMVLVGTVAGGTASNVMTYLARGDVALSVSMTAISTLASVLLTPLLLSVLIGTTVSVPAVPMLESLLRIILLPVVAGVLLNRFAGRWVAAIAPGLAPSAVLAILLIIAVVVAVNAGQIAQVGLLLMVVTLLHNLTGLGLGYGAARLLGFETRVCRTIAIEVGMQNSGLATALALKFFTPAAALPGALFSVWLNVTGSIFAAICRAQDARTLQVSQ
jgi:bile acid:Na+ symporter, BASS family